MTNEFAVEWMNPLGQKGYQPVTPDQSLNHEVGQKRWISRDRNHGYAPLLYRWKWRAVRKGKAHYRQVASQKWKIVSELERNADGSVKGGW